MRPHSALHALGVLAALTAIVIGFIATFSAHYQLYWNWVVPCALALAGIALLALLAGELVKVYVEDKPAKTRERPL